MIFDTLDKEEDPEQAFLDPNDFDIFSDKDLKR